MLGAFMVLEGPDGAGKTTQARRLAARLEDRGLSPLLVREPGATPIGEKVRALLLDPANEAMDPRAELLLYMAARAQLCREVIGPARAAGRVVVADRFLASSVAYQGVAGGLGLEPVAAIGYFAVGDVSPDLTVILDLPLEVAAARAARRAERDRIERRPSDYHARVLEGYRRYAQVARERVLVVDATAPEDEVERRIWAAAVEVLP